MVHLFVQLSKYFMIILILIYTLESFWALRYAKSDERPKAIYRTQRTILFLLHADAFLVLYLTTDNIEIIGFYILQLTLFIAIFLLYGIFYRNASQQLLNNMCMLMCIGLIILTRLSYEKAFRQFMFMVIGLAMVLLFPVLLRRSSNFFRRLKWLYAIVGIAALGVVCVAGSVSYGAKISISVAGISIQPSEFVKIIFVFFLAAMLYRPQDMKNLMITSVVAAVFVLILVASRDLGGALLYFFTYLVMIYMATRKISCFGIGLLGMGGAAVVGYLLFSHVQTRVIAWLDPLSVIDDEGYQISQSLFAIGTGGWFGLGLNQGMPSKIPVVENDFVFAAISEEMGGIFALCVIMICICCFLIIFNISMQLKEPFYRLVAMGLGTVYAFQVFLTIGGVIKFIPSTGVTLPLVSYGGSSLLATMILFGVVQAFYLKQSDEEMAELAVQEAARKAREEAAALAAAREGFTSSDLYLYGTRYSSGSGGYYSNVGRDSTEVGSNGHTGKSKRTGKSEGSKGKKTRKRTQEG